MSGLRSKPIIQWTIYLFFVLSGATGLIYELIWVRLLGLNVGNTTTAISIVLAIFMGGLAVGSHVIGGCQECNQRPLRLYAISMIGVGVWALFVPVLFSGADYIYLRLVPIVPVLGSWRPLSLLVQFALFSFILLPPVVLMGGTLPALTTHFTEQLNQLGVKLTCLYAMNTLGAVAGVCWVGFYALPRLGINLTNTLAALIDLTIGIVCLFFNYRLGEFAERKPAPIESVSPPPLDRGMVYLLGIGMFIIGFASMIYEVAWSRSLTMVLGNSTYAFSSILVIFLLGIFLGSEVHGWIRRRHIPGPLSFCLVEFLVGGFWLLGLWSFSLLPRAYVVMYHLLPPDTPAAFYLRLVLPLIVMIIPATLMGTAFPMLAEIYIQHTGRISSGVGNIYGVNALGNVFGALCAGFLFLNRLGVQDSLKLAIILNLGLGATAVLFKKSKASLPLTGASLLLGGLVLIHPPWDKYIMDSGVGISAHEIKLEQTLESYLRDVEMLYYKEGLNGIVTVYQRPDGNRSLKINGKVEASASIASPDMPTQLMVGYLPVFLHPDPKNALVIGLGSGITLRALAQYDFIRQVDCAEIEPAVVEAADFFHSYNQNIHRAAKVNMVIDDARGYIKRSPKSYDLIVSEPSNPWIKGVGNLFSLDFYRLCRQRLNPGGIMCQWIQFYGLSPEAFKMAVRSFHESFKHCQLWIFPSGSEVLVLGSQSPITLDLECLARRMNYNEFIRWEMGRYLALDSPEGLPAYFMLDNQGIEKMTGDVELNTDNYPRLEFLAPRSVGENTFDSNYQLIKRWQDSVVPPNLKLTNGQFSAGSYYYTLSRIWLLAGDFNQAYRYINQALQENNQNPRFYLVRGLIQAKMKKFMPAVTDFKRSLELGSKDIEPHLELARICEAQQRWPEAQAHYVRAIEIDPRNEDLLFSYAKFLGSQGQHQQALALGYKLRQSSRLESFQVWEFIGDTYAQLKNLDQAQTAYKKSYQINSANYMVAIKLSGIDFMQGRVKPALERLEGIREIFTCYNPQDMRLLLLVSECYIQLEKHDRAAETLREVLRQQPNNFVARQKLASLSQS